MSLWNAHRQGFFLNGSWCSGESPHALSPTLVLQSGKFSSSSPAPLSPPQGLSYAEDATEHENMKAVLKTSSPALEDATPVLGVRTRSRASRGDSWQGDDWGGESQCSPNHDGAVDNAQAVSAEAHPC